MININLNNYKIHACLFFNMKKYFIISVGEINKAKETSMILSSLKTTISNVSLVLDILLVLQAAPSPYWFGYKSAEQVMLKLKYLNSIPMNLQS